MSSYLFSCYSAPAMKEIASTRKKSHQEEALGVLCAEAQADGVPCYEVGKPCAVCERGAELLRSLRPPQPGELVEPAELAGSDEAPRLPLP